jgi:putative membrane protein insertion efficiency factor
MKRVFVLLIQLYRLAISPWLGNNCRFYPSCSHYAEEAIVTHGALKGSYLTLCRLGKCHPWHEGGIDLVPPSLPDR